MGAKARAKSAMPRQFGLRGKMERSMTVIQSPKERMTQKRSKNWRVNVNGNVGV